MLGGTPKEWEPRKAKVNDRHDLERLATGKKVGQMTEDV